MSDNITTAIKKRIENASPGTVFFSSDFTDIASSTTVRKNLGRLVEAGMLRRIVDGIYEKPSYSTLLKEELPADPEKVAYAIAEKYRWTIAPSGDIVLNKLGLSTQVPVVWSYISDGPYREYSWKNIRLCFKHRNNRSITNMSQITIIMIEALRTLGQNNVNENVINQLRRHITDENREIILSEAKNSGEWIYNILKEVCEKKCKELQD